MKKKVLSDVALECDVPGCVGRYERTMEGRARRLEEWVSEFHDFIRDHRSCDPVSLTVKRIFEEQCSFCGNEWEGALDEDGCPVCCDAAVEEWEAAKNAAVPIAT